MTKELGLAKGEFGDTGGFTHEDFLIGLQEGFSKSARSEVDLFATLEKYNAEMDEVIGRIELTVGEFLNPHAVRINRNGQITLMFKTDSHEIVGIDAMEARDVLPTAFEALHAWTTLNGTAMSFTAVYNDNKSRIGHRLPIIRRLNEALTAGEAIASVSAKQRQEAKREDFYKATEDENGMF